MKAIILAIGLALAGGSAWAQKAPAAGVESSTPFKGANIVLVHTSDSAKVALKTIATRLQSNGFVIERLDYDLLSLATKPHVFTASGAYTMTASISFSDGALALRGEWHGQLGPYSTTEAAAYTNAASKKALSELESVANAYPGGRVAYLKK